MLGDSPNGARAGFPKVILYFSDGRFVFLCFLLVLSNTTVIIFSSISANFRHNVGSDPVPIATQIKATFTSAIISIAVPGVNGWLQPVDYTVTHLLSLYMFLQNYLFFKSNTNKLRFSSIHSQSLLTISCTFRNFYKSALVPATCST